MKKNTLIIAVCMALVAGMAFGAQAVFAAGGRGGGGCASFPNNFDASGINVSVSPNPADTQATVTVTPIGGGYTMSCQTACDGNSYAWGAPRPSPSIFNWSLDSASYGSTGGATAHNPQTGKAGYIQGGAPPSCDVGPSDNYSTASFIINTSAFVSGSQHTVYVRGPGGAQGSTASYTFTVKHAPVITIIVNPAIPSLQVSTSQTFTATVTGATNPAVTWSLAGAGALTTSGNTAKYTAPASVPNPNSVSVKATSVQDPSKSSSVTFKITAAPAGTGTITVTSQNSAIPNLSVPASWGFNPNSPCVPAAGCTRLSAATYQKQPVGLYALIPISPAVNGYAFGTVCGSAAGNPSQCGVSELALASGTTASFAIKWDPLAEVGISAANMTVPDTSPYEGSVTLSNPGSPGSLLTWNASIGSCKIGGVATSSCPWFQFTNNVNSGGNLTTGNATVQLGITVAPAGLLLNTPYTATITITGTSLPCSVGSSGGCPHNAQDSGQTVTVTFVKTVAICPGDGVGICGVTPNCSLTANPHSIIVPQTSALSYSCQDVQVSTCSITGTDGTTYENLSSGGINIASGTQDVAPTENTTYTISCKGAPPNWSNYVASQSVSVTITNPGGGECPPEGCTP